MIWFWLACANTVYPTETEPIEAGVTETPVSASEVDTTGKSVGSVDMDALKTEGITVIQGFGGQLKPKLKSAMQEGGTVKAIAVCSQEAPKIAQSVSDSSGWTVRRVSLKTRNDQTATPDEWEQLTLEWFDDQVSKGVDASTLVKAEIVDGSYRLMKAQPVEGLCLSCHGTMLSPETEAALQEHYPNDVARGYDLGQVRGAFSILKALP